MADRFAAEIWIGGKVSNTKRLFPDDPDDNTTILQGLIGALHEDGASHAYGDTAIEPNCTDWDGLAKYLDDESLLHLKNDQAVNGEFPETEAFCVEHDIEFDRNSDHYCEYDAESAYWRPGQEGVIVMYTDANGREIIAGDTVRQALAKITEFETNAIEHNQKPKWEDLFLGIRLLNDACPEQADKMETFEII